MPFDRESPARRRLSPSGRSIAQFSPEHAGANASSLPTRSSAARESGRRDASKCCHGSGIASRRGASRTLSRSGDESDSSSSQASGSATGAPGRARVEYEAIAVASRVLRT